MFQVSHFETRTTACTTSIYMKSLVFASNYVRTNGPFTAFWLCLALLSISQPTAALCRAASPPGQFSAAEKEVLIAKGYSVTEIAALDFSSYKAGIYIPDQFQIGLNRAEGHVLVHFAQLDTTGARPLVYFTFKDFASVPDCKRLRSDMSHSAELRGYAGQAASYFSRTGPAIRFGEALIYAERTFFYLNGETYSAEAAKKIYADLLAKGSLTLNAELKKLNKTAGELTHEEFLKVLNELRILVFKFGMTNYCRTQASMSHFLIERCANCSAQTKILLSLYRDLNLKPPGGWSFGAELYSDHVRPVLFHTGQAKVIDLVYNEINDGLVNPILTPEGLLRKTIQNFLRINSNLIYRWETFTAKNSSVYASYSDPNQNFAGGIMSSLGLDGEPVLEPMPPFEPGNREATNFDAATVNRFGKGNPPDHANLNNFLDMEYKQGSREQKDMNFGPRSANKSGSAGEAGSNLDFFTSKEALEQLPATDRERFTKIFESESYTEEDYKLNSFANIPGIFVCDTPITAITWPLAVHFKKHTLADEGHEFIFEKYEGLQFDGSASTFQALTVFDESTYARLKSAPLSERYAWLLERVQHETRMTVSTHLPFLTEFLRSPRPADFWAHNEKQLRLAQSMFTKLGWIADDFLVQGTNCKGGIRNLDRSFPSVENEIGRARLEFAKTIQQNYRRMIEDMNQLPSASLEGFLSLVHSLNYDMGEAVTFTPDEVKNDPAYNELYQTYNFPSSGLLHNMLFDPDILYSVQMSVGEASRYAAAFKVKPAIMPPPSPVQPPRIAIPDAVCPPEGGLVDWGFLTVQCEPKAAPDNQAPAFKTRKIREVNPEILVRLMTTVDDEIFNPSWALMIFNAWRDAHTATVERLYGNMKAERAIILALAAAVPRENSQYYMVSISRFHESQSMIFSRFFEFVDAVLAVNLPYVEKQVWKDKKYVELYDDLVVKKGRDFVRDMARNSTPKWVNGNPLFEDAYRYYAGMRDANLRQPLLLAEEVQPQDEEGPLSKIPGTQIIWDPMATGFEKDNPEMYTGTDAGTFLRQDFTVDEELKLIFPTMVHRYFQRFYWTPGYRKLDARSYQRIGN